MSSYNASFYDVVTTAYGEVDQDGHVVIRRVECGKDDQDIWPAIEGTRWGYWVQHEADAAAARESVMWHDEMRATGGLGYSYVEAA